MSRIGVDRMSLNEECFNNPPLKFEELKENMWVYDKDFGDWLKIFLVKISDNDKKIIKAVPTGTNEIVVRNYKENRFYRKQVEDND